MTLQTLNLLADFFLHVADFSTYTADLVILMISPLFASGSPLQ